MKKLIMMSMFALGTITAFASNDYFKNQYAEKLENTATFELEFKRRHVVKEISTDSNGGIVENIIYDETYCGTPTFHGRLGFIIDEMYILNNTSGNTRLYNVYDVSGRCPGGGVGA